MAHGRVIVPFERADQELLDLRWARGAAEVPDPDAVLDEEPGVRREVALVEVPTVALAEPPDRIDVLEPVQPGECVYEAVVIRRVGDDTPSEVSASSSRRRSSGSRR
jgi:hypothetical protein